MNQTLTTAVVCLLLSLATVGQSAAPTQRPAVGGSTEKAVEKLMDEYTEAARKGDTAFLEKNLAREYIGIEADGHLSTKAEILELYRSGQVKFEALEIKDRKARVYAEAKRTPGGWVYRIAGKFGPKDRVPPEAIVGAWKVDADGNISGEFIENKNYDPKRWPRPSMSEITSRVENRRNDVSLPVGV